MDGNSQAVVRALGAVVLWSTAASAFRLSLDHGTPWQVLLVASATSTVVFLVAFLSGGGGFTRRDLRAATLRGALNPFLYYLVLLSAYAGLPAQVAMVVNYLWPLTLTLLAVPLLGQKLTAGALGGIAVSFSGVALMALLRGGKSGSVPLFPLVLAFASTVIWSFSWILNTRAEGSVAKNLFLNFCFGTLYLVIWGFLTGQVFPTGREVVVGGFYIGLFEMGLAFLLWNTALKRSDRASRVSNLIYITPFLSLGVIALTVREPIAPATVLGLVLVIAGIIIGIRPQKAPASR
ncbi:MAG: DMT family transporter [Candidatus Fermentibacteraceae bacterium]